MFMLIYTMRMVVNIEMSMERTINIGIFILIFVSITS